MLRGVLNGGHLLHQGHQRHGHLPIFLRHRRLHQDGSPVPRWSPSAPPNTPLTPSLVDAGVTNVRYCAATAINVTIATKGVSHALHQAAPKYTCDECDGAVAAQRKTCCLNKKAWRHPACPLHPSSATRPASRLCAWRAPPLPLSLLALARSVSSSRRNLLRRVCLPPPPPPRLRWLPSQWSRLRSASSTTPSGCSPAKRSALPRSCALWASPGSNANRHVSQHVDEGPTFPLMYCAP
jgi:hypothetical protein